MGRSWRKRSENQWKSNGAVICGAVRRYQEICYENMSDSMILTKFSPMIGNGLEISTFSSKSFFLTMIVAT